MSCKSHIREKFFIGFSFGAFQAGAAYDNFHYFIQLILRVIKEGPFIGCYKRPASMRL